MCNGQNSTISELRTNGLLNQRIGFHVYGSGGLVQNENFCLAQKCTGETDELALADAVGENKR